MHYYSIYDLQTFEIKSIARNSTTLHEALQDIADYFDNDDSSEIEYTNESDKIIFDEVNAREFRIIKTDVEIDDDNEAQFCENYEEYQIDSIDVTTPNIYKDYVQIDSSALRGDRTFETYVKYQGNTQAIITDTIYVYNYECTNIYVFHSLVDFIKYIDGDLDVIDYNGDGTAWEEYTYDEFYGECEDEE